MSPSLLSRFLSPNDGTFEMSNSTCSKDRRTLCALVTCCLHLSKPNQQMHRLICLLWGSSGFDRNSNRAKIFSIGANLALNRFWMTLNSSLWVNDDFTTSCGFRNHCNIFKCASHSLVGRMAYSRPINGCRQSKAHRPICCGLVLKTLQRFRKSKQCLDITRHLLWSHLKIMMQKS